MRIVAAQTFSIFRGLMFYFCARKLLVDLLMALGAQLFARLHQHLHIRRAVRIVAGGTFTVFRRLMFYLRRRKLLLKLFVAGETNISLGRLHLDREARLVAGGAISLLVRWMRRENRFNWRRCIGRDELAGVQWTPILIIDDRRGIRRPRGAHSIEEKRKRLRSLFSD